MANETLGGNNRLFKGRSGTLIANGTTPVVVANKLVTADSVIHVTIKTLGGTQSSMMITSVTPGVGFTIVSSAVGNTSVYNYLIIL